MCPVRRHYEVVTVVDRVWKDDMRWLFAVVAAKTAGTGCMRRRDGSIADTGGRKIAVLEKRVSRARGQRRQYY